MKKFAVIGKKYFWVVRTSQEIDEIKGGEIAMGIISLEDLECLNPSCIELELGLYWTAMRYDIKEIRKLRIAKGCKVIEIIEKKQEIELKTLKIYFERREWFVAQWQGEVFGQPSSGEDGFYITEMNDNLIEIISLTQTIKWHLGIDHRLKAKWINVDQFAKIRPMPADYFPPNLLQLELTQLQLTLDKRVADGVKQGAIAISNDGIPSRLMPVNDPKFLRELAIACEKQGIPLCLEAPPD